jgi:hypothetical protein
MRRGSEAWKILYVARTPSERTHSYTQEAIANGAPRSEGGEGRSLCWGHPHRCSLTSPGPPV